MILCTPCEQLCDDLDISTNIGIELANKVLFAFFFYIMSKDSIEPWELLKTSFLKDKSVPKSYTNKFYEILKKYNYLEESEILECISSLANSKTLQDDFDFWLRCPLIKEINYDEKTKMYKIIANKGTFSFLPINLMYEKELEIIKEIGKNKNLTENIKINNSFNPQSYENFSYNCHFVSYEFAKLNPDFYAVTAICPNCFPRSYWLHSYNVSYNKSFVIDIANNFVMDVNGFNKLISPIVLDETIGEDLSIYLDEIKHLGWPFCERTINSPLKTLAFYNYDCLSEEERQELSIRKRIRK